ncbi:MAG: hypothetical protein CMJ78_21065 [Planctomycetaceae bacterium]|nr:hypothetical protein [Planctomycetaceae bacterium]
MRKRLLTWAVLSFSTFVIASSSAAEPIRFGRDVLPILSDRCFKCHGPDETHREADLRLDLNESATATRDGRAAIVARKPDVSELLKRVTAKDADLRMPPVDSNRKQLTPREIQILRQWISEGAKWGRHWAFEAPRKLDLPDKNTHPVDFFIQRRLKREGLDFAAEAPKHTLIRRVSLDLTGLPPTLEEVEPFLADKSPDAYTKLIDRRLKSKQYGERMAMWWLDAARYSDTDGYQGDRTRTNWPWRDWVVSAFNRNMSFDQFTVEQFAGDLLPNATKEQILATCFHRNHMTNGEGGRDPEESRIDYVIDRVNTTGTVFLGMTLGCAQCHSHKFDPISQEDYYSLFAFFDSIDEDGRAGGGAKPYLKYKSPHVKPIVDQAQKVVDERRRTLDKQRREAKPEFDKQWYPQQRRRALDDFQAWTQLKATRLASVEGTVLSQDSEGIVRANGPNPRQDDYRFIVKLDKWPRITGLSLEVFPHESHTDGKLSRGANGEFILTDVKLQVRRGGGSQLEDIEINGALADVERKVSGRNYGKIRDTLDDDPRNGWTTETHDAKKPHHAVFALAEPLQLTADDELNFVLMHRSTIGDANIGRFRLSMTDQGGKAVRSLNKMPLERLAVMLQEKGKDANDAKLEAELFEQFLADHGAYQRAKQEADRANAQLSEVKGLLNRELNVMVLSERKKRRQTHLLERGVWNKKGKPVARSVPAAVLSRDAAETKTRLDLARWLVDAKNPLTARVIVNHLWQLCFGAGLVRTPEDFGLQGELPTHPDLLDWLAVELVEHDWDLQHILRLIVSSRTYRQSSSLPTELIERDPDNRLLARGSRYRLASWIIRDAALHSAGLLNPTLGGPPTRPYQPDGVWQEMFMGRFRYQPSQGLIQFRRTLYTFWRRSAAPTFLFDSAQRRVCEVRPRRTNTPLHALTLLNDLSLLEASREIARRVLAAETDNRKRTDLAFRHILSRSPSEAEAGVIQRELDRCLSHYKQNANEAKQFLQFGQPEKRSTKQPIELASFTIVVSLFFNLDEAISHE